MLGWLFIGGLAMIWAAFLLPLGHVRPSPASTVEEFERKMDILAEANGAKTGRWVLVPRKNERFLGSRDRTRLRARRRRRVVFTFLLEMTGLTLIIGMFPPLRTMLLGTAVLGGVLVVYTALLLRVQAIERNRARLARARRAALREYERVPAAGLVRASRYAPVSGAGPNGNGNGNGYRHSTPSGNGRAASNGRSSSNGHVATGGYRGVDPDLEVINGRSRSGVEFARMTGRLGGNGSRAAGPGGLGPRWRAGGLSEDGGFPEAGGFPESGVRIVEDDCHVIVRPAGQAAASQQGATSSLEAATSLEGAASSLEAAAR